MFILLIFWNHVLEYSFLSLVLMRGKIQKHDKIVNIVTLFQWMINTKIFLESHIYFDNELLLWIYYT